MTLAEARERATALYGTRVYFVQLRPDGGADVELSEGFPLKYGPRYHRLDRNAHPACHINCESAAAALDLLDRPNEPITPEPADRRCSARTGPYACSFIRGRDGIRRCVYCLRHEVKA